jgi:imidazole glycerol-phosphate synthase subunit HisH
MPPSLVAVIDYGSGNLRSAERALVRAAAESGSDVEIRIAHDPETVRRAGRIVLPGVGAFADCMAGLAAISGMIEAMDEAVRRQARPFLGICVGMQLLATESHEHGRHAGLGWIEGEVARLQPGDPALKVPQTGWNELALAHAEHPLLAGLSPGDHAYFVHSFHLRPRAPDVALAHTEYGGPVLAALAAGNIAGTQFHPEKSQRTGLRLLANFLKWRP